MSPSQSTFRAAILDATQPHPSGLSDAQGHPARRRFDVYRNNVAVSLTEALTTGFPAIAKLLGEENFHAICGVFLRQHPPTSALMMQYGAEFPDFLRHFEPLVHLGYLGDVAAFELALRRSYHAADVPPIAADALGSVPADDLGNVVMTFAPAFELLRSPWPVHAIWAFNMAEGAKPAAQSQDVIILRPDFDPEPQVLPAGHWSCLRALAQGDTLDQAAALGAEVSEIFDLSALLTCLLNGKAITSITLNKH